MSNRYSSLNRRPGGTTTTSSLFADYPTSRPSSSTSQHRTPHAQNSPYTSYSPASTPSSNTNPYSYPQNQHPPSNSHATYNPPTSTSLLSSLESQDSDHSAQTSLLSSKVSQLKQLSLAIGDEIRESSSLAQNINDQFEGASTRLKGTMRRMLRMAERTGVGWRVWVGFFVVVWCLFVWVWLF